MSCSLSTCSLSTGLTALSKRPVEGGGGGGGGGAVVVVVVAVVVVGGVFRSTSSIHPMLQMKLSLLGSYSLLQ